MSNDIKIADAGTKTADAAKSANQQPAGWSAAYESDATEDNAAAAALMPVHRRSRGVVTDSFVWRIRNLKAISTVRINGPTFTVRNRRIQVVFSTGAGGSGWISFVGITVPIVKKTNDDPAVDDAVDVVADNPFGNDVGDRRRSSVGIDAVDEIVVDLSYPSAPFPGFIRIVDTIKDRKTCVPPTIHFGVVPSSSIEIGLSVVSYDDGQSSKFDEIGLQQLSQDFEDQLRRLNRTDHTASKQPIAGTVRLVSSIDASSSFVVPSFVADARSPVLRGILAAKSFSTAVDIPVVADGKTLAAMVGYMHTGRLSSSLVWTADEALALFEIAQFYEMDQLARAAVAKVADSLRPRSALAAMQAAIRHGHFVDDDDDDDDAKSVDLGKKPDARRDLTLAAAQFLVRFASSSPSKPKSSSIKATDLDTGITALTSATSVGSDSKSDSLVGSATSASASSAVDKSIESAPIDKSIESAPIDAAARLVQGWNGRDKWNGGMLGRAAISYAAANLPAVVKVLMTAMVDGD